MTEYTAIIFGIAALMFFLLEFTINFDIPDPLDTGILRYLKIGLYGVSFAMGLLLLGIIIEVMRLQGWSTNAILVLLSWYGYWGWLIVVLLLFITLYCVLILPAQVKAITEAKNKKVKERENETY